MRAGEAVALVMAFLVVSALLGVRAVNVRKPSRSRQFAFPLVALVYSIVAVVTFVGVAGRVNGVAATICAVAGLLLFAAIKVALRPLTAAWVRGGSFAGSAVLAEFYEFDPEHSLWFVKRRLASLRTLLRAVYWGSVAIVFVVVLVDLVLSRGSGAQGVAFLVVPPLVIGECFFAVDGLTREEFEREVLSEADSANRVANYGGLGAVFAETFGDRLLSFQADPGTSDGSKTHDRLDELRHSADEVDRISGGYFQRIKQEGVVLDATLVDTAVGLMHSTSAVVNNPFYPDLTRYLAFPAYYHLLHNRNVLIVAGRDAIAADLVEWMRAGLEEVSGVPQLWDVTVLGPQAAEGLNVGVLRFADLHHLELIRNNDDFLAGVGYVILAEPAQVLATGQLGLGLVLGRCGRETPPVFVAFDRNHDGLVDALSHLLKTNVTDVVASAVPTGMSFGAVWDADGPNLTAAIMPQVTRYLGMGTEIAAVALKHQVSGVTWVGAERFPVTDMSWIAGQYHQQIAAFSELEVTQRSVSESIVPWSNPWNLDQQDNRFLVVEDEFANAYESIRLYATRARTQGFVNLISDDYLLRDYMVSNAEIFAADPKAIPSIVPDFARTERNSVLRLILTMAAFEVPATAVAKELEIIGSPRLDVMPIVGEPADQEPAELLMLNELIAEHAGTQVPLVSVMEPELDGAPPRRFYRIDQGADLERIIGDLQPAYFFVEDEQEDENYISALLLCHVYQAMLPGQFVTYGGKYYQVQAIGSAAYRSGVILRRAAEHISDRRVYRQVRRYALSGLTTGTAPGSRRVIGNVELIQSFATITVETEGFIELPSRSDLAAGKLVRVSGIPSRSYRRKALLQLRLPDVPNSVRQTIALLLNEVFVTVFPHAHQYVVAATANSSEALASLLPGLVVDDEETEGTIFIVEDSLVDLGLIVAVERNWERLFGIITDYLDWRAAAEAGTEGDDSVPARTPELNTEGTHAA